jgi:hypothetical protein
MATMRRGRLGEGVVASKFLVGLLFDPQRRPSRLCCCSGQNEGLNLSPHHEPLYSRLWYVPGRVRVESISRLQKQRAISRRVRCNSVLDYRLFPYSA